MLLLHCDLCQYMSVLLVYFLCCQWYAKSVPRELISPEFGFPNGRWHIKVRALGFHLALSPVRGATLGAHWVHYFVLPSELNFSVYSCVFIYVLLL